MMNKPAIEEIIDRKACDSAFTVYEKSLGKSFLVAKNVKAENYPFPDRWRQDYPDVIEVTLGNMICGDHGIRACKVLKTVVYVVCDEGQWGPVVEKWKLKYRK